MDFQVLQSQVAFRGRVFNVRQDRLLLPDGRQVHLDIVEHRPAVTILPVDDQGMVWFIRQYRHAITTMLLELPAGVSEPGEDPAASALRELREETGMSARQWTRIGEFYLAPGYSSEFMYVYLAEDLYPAPLPGDETEFLSVEKLPARQALQLAESGQLQDSKSLIALMWARPYLLKSGLL